MSVRKYRLVINSEGLPKLKFERSYQGNWMFDCAAEIVRFFIGIGFNEMAEEYVYLVALRSDNSPIGISEISHGSVNASYCGGREIAVRLLLMGATSFIVIHNHPSGNLKFSKEDLATAKKLRELGELLGISLLDFIVVGRRKYVSIKECTELGIKL